MWTELLLPLGALALAAFGAATILPFQSEVVFVGLILADAAPVWLLLVIASVANTLGSVVNWVLGRGLDRWRETHPKLLPASDAQLEKAQAFYARYGVWSLLLSWAPFADALTVIAGFMRTPLIIFVPIVTVAKTGRYVFVLWATLRLSGAG